MNFYKRTLLSIRVKLIRQFPLFLLAGLFVLQGCNHSSSQKIDTNSDSYRKAVSAFYQGLAAEQTDHLNYAANQMLEVTKLYPDEPASWANLGVMAMRRGNFDQAKKRFKKAKKRAPGNADIVFLEGLMEKRQENMQQALKYLKKAHKMDPENMKILYMQVQILEQQDSRKNADQVEYLLKKILDKYPQNRAALIDLARVSAHNGDQNVLQQAVKKMEQLAQDEPSGIHKRFNKIKHAADTDNTRDAAIQLTFLQNELQKRSAFQHEKAAIQIPKSQIGFLVTRFLKLPQPTAYIAPADTNISFKIKPIAQHQNGSIIKIISLRGQLTPDILQVSNKKVTINGHQSLAFPGGNEKKPRLHSIAALDYNYDFRNDLAFAGKGGFRLYRQNADSSFSDVTRKIDLPASIISGSYRGVWPADIDLDGDLDIVLAPITGTPIVLRNNGDDTFKVLKPFKDIRNLVDFAWADLDNDGDADGIFLNKDGKLSIYLNNRSMHFKRQQTSKLPSQLKAMDVSDLNRDGYLDIVTVNAKGLVRRFWYDEQNKSWDCTKVFQTRPQKHERLFINDLDNNGGMDILLSSPKGSQIWLSQPKHQYEKLKSDIPVYVSSMADLSGDQRLDLAGRSTNEQKPVEMINHGTKNYYAITIRPHASGQTRGRRINAFGVGSEIEVRTGLMYQKILAASPLVHIGLGTHKEPGMVRIRWTNGEVQADFSALSNGSIITNKTLLKGSCPWLFAYNGNKVKFITNITWSGGLGIRLNAQKAHGVVTTADRVKIRGDQLKPKNGYYDVRVTGELWEAYYFDKFGLMAVDHPDSLSVFVNGRFSVPPPSLKTYVTDHPHPIAKALDSNGNDVTALVHKRDGKYADHFSHTKYMGLAKKHFIEIDLGNNFPGPGKGTRWLLAFGWLKPTDSSINIAISQGSIDRPQPISVEVPDGRGGWITAKKNVGFPAGKNKMVMINLNGIFKHPGDHRLRLVTTTETFWDQIRWARELPDSLVKTNILFPERMNLRYRGYSKETRADSSSPGIPHYNELRGTTQRWHVQTGFYTRYGDVSPLLKKVDNRYVIMGYGDELSFRFKAPKPPKRNWRRDFVLLANGWEKDDDYNTFHSGTVRPLPSHNSDGYKMYETSSAPLKDDPVYQAHKMDWVNYHTRYVTPDIFNHVLRPKKEQ
jgi:tetratricopeptide (TPR) repeat protein